MSVQLALEIADPRREDLLDLDLAHERRYLRRREKELARALASVAAARPCSCARPLPDEDGDCLRCGRTVGR